MYIPIIKYLQLLSLGKSCLTLLYFQIIIIIILIMNFIKVSSLIAQAQCLTNYLLCAFLRSNLSTKATLRTEESGHCGDVAVMGRKGCYMSNTFLGSTTSFFFVLSSFLMCPIITAIQSYVMYKKIKYTKSFNYVLNQMLT